MKVKDPTLQELAILKKKDWLNKSQYIMTYGDLEHCRSRNEQMAYCVEVYLMDIVGTNDEGFFFVGKQVDRPNRVLDLSFSFNDNVSSIVRIYRNCSNPNKPMLTGDSLHVESSNIPSSIINRVLTLYNIPSHGNVDDGTLNYLCIP